MKVLTCFGTRPEAIKMAPLVREFAARPGFESRICVTAQHRQMLDQVLAIFSITPDFDLDLMAPDQTLADLTGRVLSKLDPVLDDFAPDLLVVQGDTTTTFAAALGAFYRRIDVAHVEAGLRTGLRYSPFPEELNRQMTSRLAAWHFPPTERAADALRSEGVPDERIFTVGNTVVDALLSVRDRAVEHGLPGHPQLAARLADRRFVLVTGHRRENFGEGFQRICRAIARLAADHPEVDFVYPVHLNPNVQSPVNDLLDGLGNVHLIPPQDYLSFVWLMHGAHLVLTDSGGVQEEAPTFGKPVLVMRDSTERPEAVEAGVALLVATDEDRIVAETKNLLENEASYARMGNAQNPYGDGTAARRIVDVFASR